MPVISQEQLDDLIDRGKRLRELTRYFQHRSEALGAYATRQHFHYDLKSAFEQPCCSCVTEPCDVIVEYQWDALVLSDVRVGLLDLLALWLFHFTIPRVRFDWIGFRTYHPFCSRCRQRARRGEVFSRDFMALFLGTTLIAVIMIAFGLLISRVRWEGRAWLIGIGLFVFICGWLFAQSMHYARTPQVLRRIARWPFRYRASVPVEDVASAMLEALEPPQRHLGVEALELKRLRTRER